VHILDNLSRRWIDTELGVQSLTPMDSIQERTRIWHAETGRRIRFHLIDLAKDYERLKAWLAEHRPDAMVHFAEQRAAPYSMKSDRHKNYTVNNNVNATHNLLNALVELGSTRIWCISAPWGSTAIPRSARRSPRAICRWGSRRWRATVKARRSSTRPNPGSIYHMTKSLDQILFQFYAQNDGLRITDLHQGIVWGTHTAETRRHVQLINRFDYDGDYGTVLNRFLIQAAIDYPLTVHGTGGQTRAFIHIQDSVRCIELALGDPPEAGRAGEDLQPDDRDAPGARSGRTGGEADRRAHRLAAEPAQGGGGERPRREERRSSSRWGCSRSRWPRGCCPRWSRSRANTPTASTAARVPAVSAWTKEIGRIVEHDPEQAGLRSVS
jgi:UDP-sulfoquinovose synthase